jgi:amidophosphoribosyltransferase
VPDTSRTSALQVAQLLGVKYREGFIKNRYIGRTFIMPGQEQRSKSVRSKLNAIDLEFRGKTVLLVDDSIVRGTTSKKIIKMVRDAGAAEVHMRIASPPTTDSCFYGVDTPEKKNLLAANYTVAEMCRFIGADSLHFVSINGLYRALRQARRDGKTSRYCDACFTGDYPTALTDRDSQTDNGQLSLLAV